MRQEQRTRVKTSSIPVLAGSTQAISGTAAALALPCSDDQTIAFSSGSTPALTAAERQRSALHHQEGHPAEQHHLAAGSLSPLREFLRRRQAAITPSTIGDIAATKTDKRHTQTAAPITDAESILASLLLPSVKVKPSANGSGTAPHQERLYIASRNKVHRPRTRKRTSSSGGRVEGAFVAGSAHLSATFRESSEVQLSSSMSSPMYGSVTSSGVPNAQQRGTVTARDYGYSASRQHQHHHHHSNSNSNSGVSEFSSPPHSASTNAGSSVILSSPFSPSNNSSTSPDSGGPPSVRTGSSSKVSQMLGLSNATSSRSPEMYMSQTATYHSGHSDSASTLNGNNRNQYAQQQRSPTTSTGSGGKDGTSPHQQSHTRMTLKKARSLFTSGGSNKSNKDKSAAGNANSLDSGLPSPQYGLPRPMGMGSYGDLGYNSPPSTSGSYAPGQSTLSHSKSHGSLQGAMHGSTRPSNPPPLPPIPGSVRGNDESAHHPYAAVISQRKASQPNLPSHTSRSGTSKAREIEQETDCPVCLESLSIRLQGEKPHVVPVCGHKLHNECFETAYNITVREAIGNSDDILQSLSRRKKRQPIGICGICRSEMRIGDPSETGKNSEFMPHWKPITSIRQIFSY